MIEAPVVRMSSGVSALTVAFVPTGMNCGVWTSPWVSDSRPTRARVEPSAGGGTSTENDAAPATYRFRPMTLSTTDRRIDTMNIVVIGM